ncbi:uncharacterized protein LOC105666847 [Bombus terrestris]|uniref:Uncharacterized protein LOC105666847 n=1 Tax=Bombus terrestris TaxID=30195 RepID=A0A9B2MRT7_BOMTE|nr:uncharacterized protein LOC105666847 [Bombus terrestris]
MTAQYDIAGTKPESLIGHGIAKEFVISGITPNDFIKMQSGLEFDMDDLRRQFKKHCPDYMEKLEINRPSKAVEFCFKVMNEIGPESRKVKKGTRDKVWKFIFINDKIEHFVYIDIYKRENAQFSPKHEEKYMFLLLEEAGLLAQETFARLVHIAYGLGHKLMTPLSAACFSKEDIGKLTAELNDTEVNVLVSINQSTQSGGHYLQHGDIDIAVCATIAATRNVKDKGLRKNIVIKVFKQYMNKGKMPNNRRLAIISKYTIGGVPVEYSYEELLRSYESEETKYSALKRAKAIQESAIIGTVIVSPSPDNLSPRPGPAK